MLNNDLLEIVMYSLFFVFRVFINEKIKKNKLTETNTNNINKWAFSTVIKLNFSEVIDSLSYITLNPNNLSKQSKPKQKKKYERFIYFFFQI